MSETALQSTASPSATAGDVNDFAHTGPDALAGKFARRFWHPVCLASAVQPGHIAKIRVLGEDINVYRGEGGTPHAVGYRCAHRGLQLTAGYVEGDDIRCPYHGWKYDPSGQCVEQPAEPKCFASRIKIPGYPTREYLGLIFVFMGEGDPPPFPEYPAFEGDAVIEAYQYMFEWNFYQHLENSVDETHVIFLHERSAFSALTPQVPIVECEETDFGIAYHGTRKGGVRRTTYYQVPFLISFSRPPYLPDLETQWRTALAWRVPADDENHHMFLVYRCEVQKDKVPEFRERMTAIFDNIARLKPDVELARDVLEGRLRMEDLPKRDDIVIVQDQVAQLGQGAIVDRTAEHLSPVNDAVILLLRRIWRRELAALRDGKPLKQWESTIPLPTSGL